MKLLILLLIPFSAMAGGSHHETDISNTYNTYETYEYNISTIQTFEYSNSRNLVAASSMGNIHLSQNTFQPQWGASISGDDGYFVGTAMIGKKSCATCLLYSGSIMTDGESNVPAFGISGSFNE